WLPGIRSSSVRGKVCLRILCKKAQEQ
ncbi:hypothetical protein DBR06_SOUSAS24210009, partial [Sousa chinensis]